ncbi:MAG: AMP-binding protein [Planctomycetota bacterium]|nr:AMP-binding protein [Planctomycetota bacterium]MDA1210990.1 AMP-binding protein [Planctomycetota bacterium]
MSMSRSEIRKIQQEKWEFLWNEIGERNPFWRARAAGQDLSFDALSQFPFTTKSELVTDQLQSPLYGTNLTYPRTTYSRLHQTSGTTGQPIRWLDTPESWNWLIQCWSQLFQLISITRDDRFCFPFSFGPFLGFWAGFEGALDQGNFSIAAGGMSTSARLKLICEHEITVVCCTPTYALRMAEVAREEGYDLPATAVRILLVAGEPGGSIPAIRRQIGEAWGARVIDHWGMTELGPMAIEPVDHPATLTLLETECIPEIIDPATGSAVSPGELGELVMTNLGRLGSPLIRYRTGDLVRAVSVEDGFLRLEGGIQGRVDDMMTIRGNNVFPSAIEAVIREFDDVAEYRLELRTTRAMNHLHIEIEPRAESADHRNSLSTDELIEAIRQQLRDRFHFQAEVVPVAVNSLPRFEMKGRRFVRREVSAE